MPWFFDNLVLDSWLISTHVVSESLGAKRDDLQVRRAAEREGRRIRRMKSREAKSILKHIEGMSSDDEVTEMESSMFKSQRGMLSQ